MNIHAISDLEIEPPLWTPKLLDRPSAWWTHVPFAFWITATCKPRTIVELGTHFGVSYAAFCEAVAQSSLATRCYAIDSWKGDAQAGYYGDQVFNDLKAFEDENYAAFSKLIRSDFDVAKGHFSDNSIDLLHIDGFHTYDAVRHDFETWRSKLSRRAVVLLHDTNVRRDDFGVWRFFEELAGSFPSFEFLHGYGLGVVAVGDEAPEEVKRLCRLRADSDISAIRERFSNLGSMWSRVNDAHREQQRQVERVRELERIEAEREASIASLLDERNNLSQQTQSLAAERGALGQKAQALSIERDALVSRMHALSAERDAIDQKAQAFLEERDALRQKVEALSVERDALGSQMRALSTKRDSLRQAIDAHRPENAEASHRLALAGQDRDGLENTLDAAHKLIEYISGRYASEARKRKLEALRRRMFAFTRRVPRKAYRLVSTSVFFEKNFYLDANLDASVSRMDPVVHYLRYGSKEGRNPSPWFSEKAYRDRYPDVAESGMSSVEHYERFGRAEGRRLIVGPAEGRSLTARPAEQRPLIAAPAEAQKETKSLSLSLRADWPVLGPLLAEYFDADWYLSRYPDVIGANSEAYEHYILFGAAEFRDPCADFSSNDYISNNPDVLDIPVAHYLLHGRNERRSPKNYNFWDLFSNDNNLINFEREQTPSIPNVTRKICCVLHIYYPDLADELLSYIDNIVFDKDVFVNLVSTSWTPAVHSTILQRYPDAKILISPDLGRDIGGFTRIMSVLDFDQYDIFFFAHSKKSPHTPESFGTQWRRELLEPLAGTRRAAANCVSELRKNSRVGLIGSRKWRNTEVLANVSKYSELLDIALIRPEHRGCEYVSGTMFFATQRVVRRLYTVIRNIQFEDGHGMDLGFHIDGQYAHAVERLIGNLVRDEDLVTMFV